MSKTTNETDFSRRRFLAGAVGVAAVGVFGNARYANAGIFSDLFGGGSKGKVSAVVDERIADMSTKIAATTYNNMYEFGGAKTHPSKYGHELNLEDWTVTLADKNKSMVVDVEELMGMPFSHLPDVVRRMRCVERWTVIVPWNGIPLSEIIKKFEPSSSAKFVKFTCIDRPSELRGQRSSFSSLDWPYIETLTMEEAMNPLTLATFGAYGDNQLAQNGMPLKINVPWKYGYKSPKAVAKIEFVEERPMPTWTKQSGTEYGWYSNVYPEISHPRWSQLTERVIWAQGDIENGVATQYLNGYAKEVAHMYPGEDRMYR